MRLLSLAGIAVGAAVAAASPLKPRGTIDANCATCDTDVFNTIVFGPDNTYRSYTIHIGRPFNNGDGCEAVHHTLSEMVEHEAGGYYECKDDGFGNTIISLTTFKDDAATNDEVVEALQVAFPMVPFVEQGICHLPDTPAPPAKRSGDLEDSSYRPKGPVDANHAICDLLLRYDPPGPTCDACRYVVQIGRPFLDGYGCAAIEVTFREMVDEDGVFECMDDTFGNTILVLHTTDVGTDNNWRVVEAMQTAYPMVPFIDERICMPAALEGPPAKREVSSVQSRDCPECPIDADHATCALSYTADGQQRRLYLIHIGRPFINGDGCAAIEQTLREKVGAFGGYECKDDGFGNTIISLHTTFDDRFTNYDVIEAMQTAYPMVPFIDERICLLSGAPPSPDWPPA